jgi:hypothetical protein
MGQPTWTDDNLLRQVVYEGLRESRKSALVSSYSGFDVFQISPPTRACARVRERRRTTGKIGRPVVPPDPGR